MQQPTSNINVGEGAGDEEKLNISISIKELSEQNSNGIIVSKADFHDLTFKVSEDTSSNFVWEYISILEY